MLLIALYTTRIGEIPLQISCLQGFVMLRKLKIFLQGMFLLVPANIYSSMVIDDKDTWTQPNEIRKISF